MLTEMAGQLSARQQAMSGRPASCSDQQLASQLWLWGQTSQLAGQRRPVALFWLGMAASPRPGRLASLASQHDRRSERRARKFDFTTGG